MKNYYLLLSVIFTANILFAQQKPCDEISNLYKIAISDNIKLEASISNINLRYQDSINKLNSTLQSLEYSKKDSISILKKENDTLKIEIKLCKELDDKKTLKKRVDSLFSEIKIHKEEEKKLITSHSKKLNILTQNERSLNSKIESLNLALEKQSNLINRTLNILEKKYNQDEKVLFNISTESLSNDRDIVSTLFPEKEELKVIINNWLTIKECKKVLSNKYQKIIIDQSIQKLNAINQTNTVKELIADLENYDEKNNAVIKLISDLEKNNESKVIGTNFILVDDKKKEVFSSIFYKIEYTPIDMDKYIYLKQIIEKIQKLKVDNIDASLINVLNDL